MPVIYNHTSAPNKTYRESENKGAEHATDEAFPCLLRRQLDEGGLSETYSEQICEDVIDNHTQLREDEPVDALVEVVENEGGDEEHENQSQHAPGEALELIAVGALLERPHEEEDSKGEQAKADYLMVVV